MSAFLFTHFTQDEGEDLESIWFALSRDGLHWTDLGGEEPVLTSQSGTTGIRDPYIVYDEKKKKYFIIATDLHTRKGGNWDDFSKRGSRCILVWESDDLISWSKERLIEVGVPEAGCVWAPEAIFCHEENKWLVFWASNVKTGRFGRRKQMIYAAYTEDFVSFSPAFRYMEADTSLIDTNIVRDGKWYYRFTKDETNKKIIVERSEKLVPGEGEEFQRLHSPLLSGFFGLEGPEAYFIEDKDKWCLIVDQYHTKKGYLPLLCDDLSRADFVIPSEDEYSMGNRKKRHGGVIRISDEQAEGLIAHFGISE